MSLKVRVSPSTASGITMSSLILTSQRDTRSCSQCTRSIPLTQVYKTCDRCRAKDRRKYQRRKLRDESILDGVDKGYGMMSLDKDGEGSGKVKGEDWRVSRRVPLMSVSNSEKVGPLRFREEKLNVVLI